MSEYAGAPVQSSLPQGEGIRQRAARFWLRFLFWSARRAPFIVRGARGFFLFSAWSMSRHIRQTTLANMRHILADEPQSRQAKAARSVVGNFYDFVCDIGRNSLLSREEITARIYDVQGHDLYAQARALGRGAIIATAHMGSFEVGMAALLEHEKRIHVVFQRDGASLFEESRAALRQRLGIVEVPVDQGMHIWLDLRNALQADEVVAIQADRVMPGQKGVRIQFLGGHIMLPAGPVKLAMVTGSPIVPIFSLRQPDGRVRIAIDRPILVDQQDPAAFEKAMSQLAAVLARYVRQYPDQWLMFQKVWCEDTLH